VVALDDEAHMTFTRDDTRLFYRSVPMDDPAATGTASAISQQGEPLAVPHYDVTVRAGEAPDAGPAAIWLRAEAGSEQTPFVDAFWFPPSIGVPVEPVPDLASGVTIRALPNPFRRSLAMDLGLERAGAARVAIYDPRGRLVRRLGERELAAGKHLISWDGRDDRGRAVPAGVYFLTVRTPAGASSQRVVRLP